MVNEKKVYVKGLGNCILHNLGHKLPVAKPLIKKEIVIKSLYELQKVKDFIP